MLIVLLAATATALLFERFRLPALLGFILAGTFIGPHGFKLISDLEHIHQFAEVGMIFLMLTIGLEFSFEKIRGLKKVALVGGSAQILLSIGLSITATHFLGWTVYQGFVLGSVIALSSTAVVFRNLIDRGHWDSQHGRLCIAILIFQDLAVGPLLIFINSFGASQGSVLWTVLLSLTKAAALLGAVLAMSRYILPVLMRWVALSKSREVFILSTVLLCFGMSWISSKMGLSAPLGAFFAGLMLANTDYHHQVAGDVMPFRHIFISIFFVSIGILFDPVFAMTHASTVIPIVGLVLFVNIIVVTIIMMALGYSPRVAITTGIILSQIGEFSFLLLENAKKGGLINDIFYQLILSASVITILLTPFLFSVIGPLMKLFSKIPFLGMPPQAPEIQKRHRSLRDHIILCGYGTSGQDLVGALILEKIPFVVIEMNPANIQRAKAHQIPFLYGDALNEAVLNEAAILKAKAIVISFGDSSGIAQIIRTIQRLNGELMIVARARYEKDVAWLYELGADVVIMEELELSIEMTRVILDKMEISDNIIRTHISRIRARKEFLIEQSILKKIT